jgi:hypothetical protein
MPPPETLVRLVDDKFDGLTLVVTWSERIA